MAPIAATQPSVHTREPIPAQRVLFSLIAPDLNARWLVRSARTLGWALTAYSCIPFIFLATESPPLAQFTIRQNLIVLSWLAGIASLTVASPAANSSTRDITTLRGVSSASVRRVEWAVACSVPFGVLVPAGLAMSALSTFSSATWADGGQGLLTVLGAGCYVLLTTAVLGLTALWSRRLSPNHGRSLFLLLTLLPVLLEQALTVSSIPSLLGQALSSCLGLGAAP